MSDERKLLVIADIGGYTQFMRLHRTSLAHAEVTTGRLLERIIDAVPEFDLVEIEGDAAFLASDELGDSVAATTDAAVRMHRAFHAERHRIATNMCPCHGCELAAGLTLKFVAHLGDVAVQTIRDREKLVGIDVIHVHRMLKNSVPVAEYVLVSEVLYGSGGAALPDPVHEIADDLEGIGPARAYFVEVETIDGPLPELRDPSVASRMSATAGMLWSGLPYMVGLRRPRSADQELPAH